MELALAIVSNFSIHLALAIIAIAIAIAATRTNRRWAEAMQVKDLQEHKRKQYELETERSVKLQTLTRHPDAHPGPKLEHRTSDRGQEE